MIRQPRSCRITSGTATPRRARIPCHTSARIIASAPAPSICDSARLPTWRSSSATLGVTRGAWAWPPAAGRDVRGAGA
ncbi:hypothetical protein [Nannocystis pusilla]|uniref:hypothetical protein n=1 Tax=Nannocystis pusilla TaxID=889268 RepID=UPI003B8166DF